MIALRIFADTSALLSILHKKKPLHLFLKTCCRQMITHATVLTCMALGGFVQTVHAEEYHNNVEVTTLLTSSTTTDGQPLHYLQTEHPQVTALLVRIPAGKETGWHQHPVPVYAYMVAGELSVELKNGQKFFFKKGDVIFEVMNTWHNGYNYGNVTAELVAFYTGAAGIPNVVKEKQ